MKILHIKGSLGKKNDFLKLKKILILKYNKNVNNFIYSGKFLYIFLLDLFNKLLIKTTKIINILILNIFF